MRSVTELPLHGGHAPGWLFGRMVKLSGAIAAVIIDDFGPDELLRRIADPNWFQALACAIGYDLPEGKKQACREDRLVACI